MEDYYRRRASEYEEVYEREDPQRKRELEGISTAMRKALAGRDVLEVACGTGYWTSRLSAAAKSIAAIDIVKETLEIAGTKSYGCPVRLILGDGYSLPPIEGEFDGGLANFWLSHVPHEGIETFLRHFHARLVKGSKVFMADNAHVPGAGGELVRRKNDRNTYKLRELKDGTEHLVLKNYFSEDELRTIIRGPRIGATIEEIRYGTDYWFVIYRI